MEEGVVIGPFCYMLTIDNVKILLRWKEMALRGPQKRELIQTIK